MEWEPDRCNVCSSINQQSSIRLRFRFRNPRRRHHCFRCLNYWRCWLSCSLNSVDCCHRWQIAMDRYEMNRCCTDCKRCCTSRVLVSRTKDSPDSRGIFHLEDNWGFSRYHDFCQNIGGNQLARVARMVTELLAFPTFAAEARSADEILCWHLSRLRPRKLENSTMIIKLENWKFSFGFLN